MRVSTAGSGHVANPDLFVSLHVRTHEHDYSPVTFFENGLPRSFLLLFR